MKKEQEEYKGLGYGPGVDPIPVPKNPTSSTDMLEDVVDEMLNGNEEKSATHQDQTAESRQSNNNKNR